MKNRYVSELMTMPRKSLTARRSRTITTTRTIDRAEGDDDTSDTRWICSDFSPRMFSFEVSAFCPSLWSAIIRSSLAVRIRVDVSIREHRSAVRFRIVFHFESFVHALEFARPKWKAGADDDGLPFIGYSAPVRLRFHVPDQVVVGTVE